MIITKIVWDSDLTIVERVTEPYSGDWAKTKGNASKAEQASADTTKDAQNQLMLGQLKMNQQQLASLNSSIDPIINSLVQGQTPPVLQGLQTALDSSVMNGLAGSFRQGAGAINNMLTARGITGGQTGAGGGAAAQDFGQMAAMLGTAQQQGISQNAQIMNQQRLGLLQNDLGLKMGVANAYGNNTGMFNSGQMSALGSGVTAANNADQAQTSWMGPVFGALGSMTSFKPICWIAAECYDGWTDPRVQFIQLSLALKAMSDLKFRLLVLLYQRTGRYIAHLVGRSPWVRKQFKKMFDTFALNEIDAILNRAI